MARATVRTTKIGFDRFTESQFEPYVMAIGQLVLAWNSLHEVLGWTYQVMLTGSIRRGDADKGPQAREGWNSLNSDRDKRRLLEAICSNLTEIEKKRFPVLSEDMKWLLKTVESMEDMRNNMVHSPLVLMSQKKSILMYSSSAPDFITPDWLSGNRRALNLRKLLLKQKELLKEFRWCRDSVLVLRDFAVRINHCWGDAAASPWPKRPALPNRGDKKIRSRH